MAQIAVGRRGDTDVVDLEPPRPRDVRRLARAVIAAVSLLALLGSGLAWTAYQGFVAGIPHGDPVPSLAAGQKDPDGAARNILLVGSDSRAGASPAELKALGTADDGGTVNSDTMMILHIPADGSRATIVSLPRDSWVDIPDNGKGKLNSAYPDGYNAVKSRGGSEIAAESGGLRMLIRTITALTGLYIDDYVQVDLLGFYRISNAIGGVNVCLLHAQNPSTDSDANGRGYSGIDLPAGWSTIKGTQALAFVRQRHGLPNGDLDRVRRQQYFLSAAFKKISTSGTLLNPFRLRDLLKAVSSSLLTDPALDLLSLARQFADLSAGNITFRTLPNNGPQTIYPDGVETSIVAVDTAAIPGFVNQLMGKPADPSLAGAIAASPATVTLDVLNGTDVEGLAARNATALRAAGFKVDTVDSAAATVSTTIEYPTGQQSQAKAVEAVVPGAAYAETSSVSRVTLVLGSNDVQVKGAAAQPGAGARTSPPAPPTTPSSTPTATTTANCIN